MSDVYQLGDRVTFTRSLRRRNIPVPVGQLSWARHYKSWLPEAWPGQPEPTPTSGIVIGVRTLSNGYTRLGGYDDSDTWVATHYLRAYVIAFNLRRRPVLVLPEHITPTTKETP